MANRYLGKSTIELVAEFLASRKQPATDTEIGHAIDRNRAGVYMAIQKLKETGHAATIKGFGAVSTGKPYFEPVKNPDTLEDVPTIHPDDCADVIAASLDGVDVAQWREKITKAKASAGERVPGFIFHCTNPGSLSVAMSSNYACAGVSLSV